MALVKWIQLRKLVPLEDLIAALQGGGSVPLTPAPARQAAPTPRPAAPPAPTPPARKAGSQAAEAPASRTPEPQGTRGNPTEPPGTPDLKSSLLSSVREQNKVFFGMVVAQAQSVVVERDTVVFTFAPVHKALRAQLDGKRSWLEHLAQAVAGRKISVVAREGQPAPAAAPGDDPAAARKAGLRDRAKAEPTVQAVLDVFGGEIEDVQEIE